MKKRALWIDQNSKRTEFVDIEDKLDELYRCCDCDCIDITTRSVLGTDFSIVCDDIGLLRGAPVSVLDPDGMYPIVGSVLVFGYRTPEGELSSLTNDECFALTCALMRYQDGEVARPILLAD